VSDTKQKVREFLSPRLGGQLPDDSEDMFAAGYANSLFAMQLVRFVRDEFTVDLEPADMDLANFRSIDQIAALVDGKTTNGGDRAQ
jgi:methoxymalonate biosynthesis acyl carrier protein